MSEEEPMTAAEFFRKHDQSDIVKLYRQWWGSWYYDPYTLTLTSYQHLDYSATGFDPSKNTGYPVPLGGRNMNTSAQMLDWIMQVACKAWATSEILGDLVHALNDIFHPQANHCSGGRGKVANGEKIAAEYANRIGS